MRNPNRHPKTQWSGSVDSDRKERGAKLANGSSEKLDTQSHTLSANTEGIPMDQPRTTGPTGQRARVTRPIPIPEHSIPIPKRRFSVFGYSYEIRRLLSQMRVGDHFACQSNAGIHHLAKQAGVKITTRKLLHGGYIVWRVE